MKDKKKRMKGGQRSRMKGREQQNEGWRGVERRVESRRMKDKKKRMKDGRKVQNERKRVVE